MRLDLAERLRCPRSHASTPLIVVADEVTGRDLRRGVAGCPVCQLEARIDAGDVWFGADRDDDHGETRDLEGALDRLIALCGLAEPGGAVLLTGRYGRLAERLTVAAGVSVVLIHPRSPHVGTDEVSTVHGERAQVPFIDQTFRAAALDAGFPESFIADVARSVQVGGRIVAAASVVPPEGVSELARDAAEWVGARERAAVVVELGRRK